MKITALKVDGFGVWSELELNNLDDGLNVFCGPNEAGKTTLLQFIRSILYGFSPERQHYLPPIRGGRPGGSVHIAGPNGRFEVSRYTDETDETGRAKALLCAADGTQQSEHLLKVLLCNIDEPIFNNIFAIGLQELQELGTLSDTEAASQLYSLSVGLDRVSLVEVMRELKTSRNHLLRSDGQPSQITQLLEQREKMIVEIDELSVLNNRYNRLAGQRNQIQHDVTRFEEEKNQLQHESRTIEIASTVRPKWEQRKTLDDQLAMLGPLTQIPEGAIDRLDLLKSKYESHKTTAKELKDKWNSLRSEASSLNLNESLWRQAARIEALQEQEGWIGTLEDQIAESQNEIDDAQAQLDTEQQQLGLSDDRTVLTRLSTRTLGSLRSESKAIRQTFGRLKELQQAKTTAEQTVQSLTDQINTGLLNCNESELGAAIERNGQLVNQLRRRVALDERVEQMDRNLVELEEQNRSLLTRQLMPIWVLIGLGGVFVFGVMLVMAGLFMPASITGSLGWALAILGLAGAGTSGVTKVVLDRSNARQLEACQKQINMLQLQVRQAKEERDSLDAQLPNGGGPIVIRLQEAEKQLAVLETLATIDSNRQAALQELNAVSAQVEQAKGNANNARQQWRGAIRAIGLPENLSPKQVREVVQRCDRLTQSHSQIERRREELHHRRRELTGLTDRINQLADNTGVTIRSEKPLDKLREMAEALANQEVRYQRRQAIRNEARHIRRKRSKVSNALTRLKFARRELLAQVGADSEQEFRHLALQHARAQLLNNDREKLHTEITAVIGGHCPEDRIGEIINDDSGIDLDSRWDKLQEQLQNVETELKQQFEKRGEFTQELKTLAEDNRPAKLQLELSMVEERLKEAIQRWQSIAVANRVLDSIRDTYERDRQPETLQEASGYLDRLTQGRYTRIWTPLGEDVLRVDDANDNTLTVDSLSRGTREQLFLSLRLALTASYARHGAPLPLVLDDVLVNFDDKRAKAAAGVLRDFANAGHQLLVFTCHEHVLKLFKALKVSVSRLPNNAELPDPDVISPKRPSKKKTKTVVQPPPVEIEATFEQDDTLEEEEEEVVTTDADTAPWEEVDAVEEEPDEELEDEDEDEYEEEEEGEEYEEEDEELEAEDEWDDDFQDAA